MTSTSTRLMTSTRLVTYYKTYDKYLRLMTYDKYT